MCNLDDHPIRTSDNYCSPSNPPDPVLASLQPGDQQGKEEGCDLRCGSKCEELSVGSPCYIASLGFRKFVPLFKQAVSPRKRRIEHEKELKNQAFPGSSQASGAF